ncbi:hypothetical protein [Deinococcus cellulosilyticus]|uniref:Phage portal protein n=1 Tax=Deinococcus cellulosilyticus (strain DSM 18568 / NBRC 106333 / KACC 11606 / 5516J-15) TaxID=1223518 RepID=A0A511N799_DEIC1|nr:hypothetical protein [Deinococcus cellulosilyticus]GEM48722.1 hypothetical protein DC3_43570 [Deinococcus cellulosilyticus NBRC 106333 = KACC 11606]
MFFRKRSTPRSELPSSPEFSEASRVMSTPQAPVDERKDAEVQALKQAAPYAQSLNPQEVLAAAQQIGELFYKAANPTQLQNQWGQGQQHRTQSEPRVSPGVARVNLDLDEQGPQPFALRRPVGYDFPALRQIVKSDVLLQSIQWTRIWQVQRFLKPSKQEWKPGFQVRYTNDSDISEEGKAKLRWISQYLLNCGAVFDPRKRRQLKRDRLRDFAAKLLQDSMTYDAGPIEIVTTLSGRPHGFVHVDGSKVFLTDPNYGLEEGWGNPELHERFNLDIPDPSDVIAVLSWDNRILAHYTHDDFLYTIRKPSPLLEHLGYGQPEPEELIQVVTGFINAMTMNIRGLSHNSIPKGILTLFGDFQDGDLQQFKTSWDAYVTGITNAWRMPVMVAKDKESGAVFTKTDVEFNEMYFSKWMTFLVAVKCALYGMDPEEVNFEAFTSNKSSLSGDDTEERLASSKDKGLWPMLDWLGGTLDDVVKMLDPDAEFVWTGLDSDQKASQDAELKMLTLGEYRQRRGEAPHPMDVLNDAPLDPSLQTIYTQELQAKRAQELQAQQEPQDEEGPEDADEDGNRQMLDHEGNLWQVKPGMQLQQDDAGEDPDEAQPAGPGGKKAFMAKATVADMETWP